MLSQSVVFAGIFLVVSSLPLFAFGHRFKAAHWSVSQLAALLLVSLSWLAQVALTGHSLPFGETVIATLVLTSMVAAACPDWTSLAHVTFAAVICIVATFLGYAGFVLAEAQLGPASLVFGVLLLLLQAAVLLLLVAHTFEILDVVCRTRWHRQFAALIVPGYRPKVSIHVPTHNEPPALVIETLNALARLDYDNYEVLVIDNNTRDESLWRPLEAHCERLGSRFRFFHLLPWPGFKSGALNFALEQVAPDTEIIGVVDADYLVEPNYLRDLVGHFADSRVGFVQTPQDYRDASDRGRFGRALYLSYQYFFGVSMASRNERNAIIFAGTMGLIRRDALRATGGWDEWCITEDAEVSFRLLKAGYDSVFIEQSYGRGLMPFDYAGLKKQRFRWAFGGMQLLRMHAPVVFGFESSGRLTRAQRYAYISGGLQWLNDPVTFGFTIVLLIAASALAAGGSIYIQPLVGATVLVPPLLIWFGVMRFLWALRLRCKCSWREAIDAFVILLGLTWVVTLACVRGLLAREGVFLRTPKESDRPRLRDALRVVWFEAALSLACFAALAAVVMTRPDEVLSARLVLIAMLAWQGLLYASAARTSLWNLETAEPGTGQLTSVIAAPFDSTRLVSEPRLATVVGLASVAFAALFWVAVVFAPSMERIWRTDPLDTFLTSPALLPPSPESLVARQLVREAEAARRHDVDTALALWDPHGVIHDYAFTPDRTDDDRIWIGLGQVRQRYEDELQARRYRRLRHLNLAVTFDGDDQATIVNDLDAVIESDRQAAHVRLTRSDRWRLRRVNGDWRIVQLEINRTPREPTDADAADHQLTRAGRP